MEMTFSSFCHLEKNFIHSFNIFSLSSVSIIEVPQTALFIPEKRERMIKLKRFLALMMALMLVMALSACSGSGESSTASSAPEQSSSVSEEPAPPTAEELLVMGQKALMEAESLRYTANMEMTMTLMDQTIEAVSTSVSDTFQNPQIKSKSVTTTDMGEMGTQETTSYTVYEDGVVTVYTYDGTNWYSQQMEMDLEQIQQAMNSTQVYLELITDLKEEGNETVNGVETMKVTGTYSGDAMQKVMDSSGAASSLGSLTGGLDLSNLYSEMGDLTATMWLDLETGIPVQYEMDMTEPMANIMNYIMEQLGEQAEGITMTVDKMTMNMSLSQLNSLEDFEIPEEALAAAPLA